MKTKWYSSGRIGRITIAWLLSVMMMVTFVPVFAFAGTEDQSDEGISLDKIVFSEGINMDWSHAWTVDGKNGMVSPEDMGITVKDETNKSVDPENYSLCFMRTYYDEQTQQEISDPAEPPFRIDPADQVDSVGFTEYGVYATANEGSGYSGSTEYANFCIVDKYSLNYFCAEKEFNNYIKHDSWRAAERYWVSISDLAAGTSITTLAGDALEEGEDYTVTYYSREADPSDDPDVDRDEVLTPVEENELEGVPDEDGGYLAVFSAKENSGYYGEDVVLLDVGDYSEMFFRAPEEFDEEEDVVYDDGTFTYTLMMYGIPDDAVIKYTVVRGNGQELPEGCCSIDKVNNTVTLNGTKLAENNVKWVRLRAEAEDDEGEVICRTYDKDDPDDWTVCSVKEASVEYGYDDESVLPGRDYTVDGQNYMFIEDTAHPFGEEISYSVTSVEVTKGAALIEDEYLETTGGKTYIKKVENEDNPNNYCFYFQTKKMSDLEGVDLGDIKLKVTYQLGKNEEPPEAQTGTFDFTITVSTDVYGVDLYSEDGSERALPGKSITLIAEGWHDSVENGYTEEGLEYRWSFDWGNGVATLAVDDENPSVAVVTFNDIPADYGDRFYEEDVQVRVDLYDGNNKVDSNACYLETAEEFYQIEPLQIDNPEIGQSVTVTPELMHYTYGQNKPSKVKSADISLVEYDDEVLDVKEKNGTWTITRLNDQSSDVRLLAEWGDDEEIEVEYWFGEKDYYIDFHRDFTVSSDCQTDVELDTSELGEWDYDLEFEVGKWVGDQWVNVDDVYVANDTTVTIFGDALAQAGLDSVDVHAKLMYEGEALREARCRVDLDNACEHDWDAATYEWADDCSEVTATRECQSDESHKQRETVSAAGKVTKAATCDAKGTTTYTSEAFSNNAFEVQTKNVDIPAKGHKWDTKTDPAGMFQYGKTYEKCRNCNATRNEVRIDEGTAPNYVKKLKVAKGKKAITVKWKKQSKKNLKLFNGYEIQVATDSGFKNIVKTATAGKKSKSKKFKGLQKKTVYYVRVRSFTQVGGNKYYSGWSYKTGKTK